MKYTIIIAILCLLSEVRGLCCKKMSAECLACKRNISEEEVCRQAPRINVKGKLQTQLTGCDKFGKVCCKDQTSSCMSCSQGLSNNQFCNQNPGQYGCKKLKPLPSLGINKDLITIAGYSSGSSMSMAMHVAYSETFKGAGLMNGRSYSIDRAEKNQKNDSIDDLGNLEKSPVYISTGLKDTAVPEIQQDIQNDFYINFKANTNHLKYKNLGHMMYRTGPYDQMQYLLSNLPGSQVTKDQPLNPVDKKWMRNGILQSFDQQYIIDEVLEERNQDSYHNKHGLGTKGWIYYPKSCDTDGARCAFQMVLHGCGGNVGNFVYKFAPVASQNNIVMVFPHAVWCWSTHRQKKDDDFMTRDFFNMKFLKKIVDKITGSSVKGKGKNKDGSSKTDDNEGKKDEGKKDEGKKDDGKKDEAPQNKTKDEAPKTEAKEDELKTCSTTYTKTNACVNWNNIELYHDKTVDECKKICDDTINCVGFEYFSASDIDSSGKSNKYKEGDCQPQSSTDTSGCNWKKWQMIFYKKEEKCVEKGNTSEQKPSFLGN